MKTSTQLVTPFKDLTQLDSVQLSSTQLDSAQLSTTQHDSAQLSANQLGKHYPSKGSSMMNLTKSAYNLESY